jgi:hypothetical protein
MRGIVRFDRTVTNDPAEETEFWCKAIPSRCTWFGMVENFPDFVSGVVEFPGDLSDGLSIATRPPNGVVIVHRKHFCASVRMNPCRNLRFIEGGHGRSFLDDHIARKWVSLKRSVPTTFLAHVNRHKLQFAVTQDTSNALSSATLYRRRLPINPCSVPETYRTHVCSLLA